MKIVTEFQVFSFYGWSESLNYLCFCISTLPVCKPAFISIVHRLGTSELVGKRLEVRNKVKGVNIVIELSFLPLAAIGDSLVINLYVDFYSVLCCISPFASLSTPRQLNPWPGPFCVGRVSAGPRYNANTSNSYPVPRLLRRFASPDSNKQSKHSLSFRIDFPSNVGVFASSSLTRPWISSCINVCLSFPWLILGN